jgi:hypothetical protein
MAVPYTFGSATTSIPLSQLDSNFATTITLGNTAVQLGNTITTLTGVSNLASATSLTLGSNGNTTAVTIDTSQNVGIGTTPSSWGSGIPVIQTTSGYVYGSAGNSRNAYYNGTNWKYISTGSYATLYQGGDNHTWSVTTSTQGANNNITWNAAMTLDSSGNLLVGTTSNPTSLKIVASGTDNNNLIGSYNTASGNAGLRLQANQAGLYLQGSGTVDPLYITNTSSNGYISFRPGSDTERVRLVSNGTFMVGTTNETPAGSSDTKGISLNNQTTSSQIYATGNNDTCAVFNRAGSDGATVRLRRQGTDVGSISVTGSATAYNTSSDYRLKNNITPMTGALTKVAQLKPVTYKWNVDGSNGEGFIAHELAEVCPHAVVGEKDETREEEYKVTPEVKDEQGNITTPAVMGTRTVPVYQGVDTSFLVATLTAAIQELKTIVDAQAAEIEALKAKVGA